MIRTYTPETVIPHGIVADLVVNGEKVKYADWCMTIGPFIIARLFTTYRDNPNRFVVSDVTHKIARRYVVGIGGVMFRPIGA